MNERTTQKLLGAIVLLLAVIAAQLGFSLTHYLVGGGSLTGSGEASQMSQTLQTPAIGSDVKVYFTRESLGIGSLSVGAAVSPTVDSSNGTDLGIGGILKMMNGEWVVLQARDNPQQEYWIPRKDVLWIYAFTGK